MARILTKRGAGIQLSLSQTTPKLLAERIIATLGTVVSYPDIPANGAQKAAQSIVQLLERFVKP